MLPVMNNNDMKKNVDMDKHDAINVYRYNFEEKVMDVLSTFAKMHQYDDRKVYKEAWKLWIEENEQMIKQEESRLIKLGYDGDTYDKMYKAARYYFRKKSSVKPEPKKRRKYISMDHELITSMDQHILRHMINKEYTPSSGYSDYCNLYTELIKSEIVRMIELEVCQEEITHKFKKTYKNRYFILSRNINLNHIDNTNDNSNNE